MSERYTCYLAEFDYKAEQQDELSIAKGELLYDAEQEEDGWLRGRNAAGRRGLFPDNFVKPCRLATLRRVDAKLRSQGLEANSAVYIMSPVPAASTVATVYVPKLAAKFPVPLAYLDVGGEAGGGGGPTDNHQQPKAAASATPLQTAGDPAAPAVAKQQQHAQPRQQQVLQPSSPEKPPKPPKSQQQPQQQAQHQTDYVIVIHPYTAEHRDELTICVDDVIRVMDRHLDEEGWWQGELNGRVGVFPDNFVQPCAPDKLPAAAAAAAAAVKTANAPPTTVAARPPGSGAAARHTGGTNGSLPPPPAPSDHLQQQQPQSHHHHVLLANPVAGRPKPAAGKRPPGAVHNKSPPQKDDAASHNDASQATSIGGGFSGAEPGSGGGGGPHSSFDGEFDSSAATSLELRQELRRMRAEAAEREREIQELTRFRRSALESIASLKEEVDSIKKSYHACCVDMDRVRREMANLAAAANP